MPRETPERPPEPRIVLAWNAHVGNRNVTDALDRMNKPRAHDIILNEVPHQYGALSRWAKANGYAHLQEAPGDRRRNPVPEEGSTAVLVDTRRVELHSWRVVVMDEKWTVWSKDRVHEPRRQIAYDSTLDGQVYDLVGSHWATKGNRAAQAESLNRCARLLRNVDPGVVGGDIGDHNISLDDLRAWARTLELGVRVAGRNVDSAVIVGAALEREVLPKNGDHHPIRHTITPKE